MEPFQQLKFRSLKEALAKSFNPKYWRIGITVNQGNAQSVSYDRLRWRLTAIKKKLLRIVFGNNWRKKARIVFMIFEQGLLRTCNRHFHVLVGIEGERDWDDERLAREIECIDREVAFKHEKAIHVDFNWKKGSRFHEYVSRECAYNPDSYSIL